MGNYEQAIADYTQALALDPQYAYAYEGRGLAYRELGNLSEALADFRQYLVLTPDANNRATFEEWIAELEEALGEGAGE